MDPSTQPNKITPEGNPGFPEGESGVAMLHRMNSGNHKLLSEWGLDKAEIPADAACLDIGCGGGANLLRLLAVAPEGHATGIDHSACAVETSRQTCADAIAQGRADVLEGSADALPFGDKSLDVVTAFETIYFWPDLHTALIEIRRVLKPGGILLICNEDDGENEAMHAFVAERDDMRTYTEEQLREALAEAGLRKVDVYRKPEIGYLCAIAHA